MNIRQLRQRVNEVNETLTQIENELNELIGVNELWSSNEVEPQPKRTYKKRKRKMSIAQRKAISRAQKLRWSKIDRT